MAATRRRRAPVPRVRENLRPPRYRLLTAAAAIPRRATEVPTESFRADCPACSLEVTFTQVHTDDGIEYTIEDHACAE